MRDQLHEYPTGCSSFTVDSRCRDSELPRAVFVKPLQGQFYSLRRLNDRAFMIASCTARVDSYRARRRGMYDQSAVQRPHAAPQWARS